MVTECLPGCNLIAKHYGHCMQINLHPKSKDDWLVRCVDPEVEAAHLERKAAKPPDRRRRPR